MIPRMVVGLVLVASMLGPGAASSVRAADAKQPPDLTGQWRLDLRRSDSMQRPQGGPESGGPRGGRGGGPGGGGGEGGRGGMGGRGWGGHGGGPRGGPGGGPGPGQGEAGPRPVRLPDLIHVTQTATIASFEDSTGAVVQEITTLGDEADTLAHAPGAVVLNGQWKGEKLEVQRQGPRGGKMTQTFTLEGKGNTLVIHTKIESSGDMPAREFKRVYQRVSG
jgi:hypothetical protein